MIEPTLQAIARAVSWTEKLVFSDVVPVSLCKADSRRLYVGFVQGGAGTNFLTTSQDPAYVGGVELVNVQIVEFDIHKHGTLCQAEWFALPSGSINPITVWEVFMPGE